ncbi:MAG: tryptophan--tRNA ligase [Planctomycetales bacterium]
MKVLSGIQPTGRFHWGNYFGAIRQYIALQGNEQSFYFIADLHALTTVHDPAKLQEFTQEAAVDLLALGLDPAKATLFRQSDVPEVNELMWLLMTVTQMHLLEKCHAYKDKKAKGLAADAGLFTYPVLMAADILLYDSDIVPVGSDQVQHIEVTRDIALRFNSLYGEALTLPNAKTLDESAKVPGTDGEKMSKSYGNTIELFEPEKNFARRSCRSRPTPTPVEEPKNPDTCAGLHPLQTLRHSRAASGPGGAVSRGRNGLRRSEAGFVRSGHGILRPCARTTGRIGSESRSGGTDSSRRGTTGPRKGTAGSRPGPSGVWAESDP